ncbi:shootin-1 isoform X2 [Drosophila obscura]|uniref:shootin-1 isoform X2 n=1 Tax=Drosophila obscura TaxID=7282 RepID=UPI001BB14292|nr:shootin-1 isoform X2 [Drosophila obscura]
MEFGVATTTSASIQQATRQRPAEILSLVFREPVARVDSAMESDKLNELNRQINEIKKRILLAEGQKTANAAEWQKQNRINCDTIGTLKKELKELTVKASRLRNPPQRPVVIKESSSEPRRAHSCTPTMIVGKATYPVGAKNADDALFLTDLKITENRKQMDLLRHRFKSRQQHFSRLVEKYRELLANKEAQNQNLGEKPPETLEEDANRKLVCQLENEIHRTNVQWMEAEHIRKKYRSIEASLMNDAERFERSLRELEASLSDQKAEIERLQQVHNEAIEMRDAAKVVLTRQEQQANLSQKTRERQALDFRKQVEARKLELERIGRKLFAETKTLVHQDSVGSTSGDPLAAKAENGEEEPASQLASVTSDMESLFKQLMEASGATSPLEVFERFSAQKESAARLNYLRKAAEAEKANLESEREALTGELEAFKFSDVKESEVNQEIIEQIKNSIAAKEQDRKLDTDAADKSMGVLKYLKERICEMIFKVQEVDENNIELPDRRLHVTVAELPSFLTHTAQDEELIELKIKRCQELSKSEDVPPFEIPKLDIVEQKEEEELYTTEPPKSPSAPEGEKPQPMPLCYYNLFAGRAQRAAGTSSSSPEQAPAAVAATDDDTEVPSRNFLKRQSVFIVDSKSRRKPFRPTPGGRRK